MKTRTTTIGKRIAMMMILTILVNAAFAQNRQQQGSGIQSITCGVGYSGNGLGASDELSIGYGSRYHQFDLAVLSNDASFKFNGLQASYQYFLCKSSESTSLYISLISSYRVNSELTKELNMLMHSSDFNAPYEKFNTIDLAAGFGLKQKLAGGFAIETSINVDYYNRKLASGTDKRSIDFTRYSEDSGIGLNVKLGITYEF